MVSKTYKCTQCGGVIGSAKDVKRHPSLGVAQCSACHTYYNQVGDLSQYRGGMDTNGMDNYCRWCLNGGELIMCADEFCKNTFCRTCIERNLAAQRVSAITSSDDWYCFICDYTQLDHLRTEVPSIYLASAATVSNSPSPTPSKASSVPHTIDLTLDDDSTPDETPDSAQANDQTSEPETTPNTQDSGPASDGVDSEPICELIESEPAVVKMVTELITDVIGSKPDVDKEIPVTRPKPKRPIFKVFGTSKLFGKKPVTALPDQDGAKVNSNQIEETSKENNDKPQPMKIDEPRKDNNILPPINISELQEELSLSDSDEDSDVKDQQKTSEEAITTKERESNTTPPPITVISNKPPIPVKKPCSARTRWAIRDAKLLKMRLESHVKILQSSLNSYDESQFEDNPDGLISWARNLGSFLDDSGLIKNRCLHLFNHERTLKR